MSGLGNGAYAIAARHPDYSWQKQNVTLGDVHSPPTLELADRVVVEGRLLGEVAKEGVPLFLTCEDGELARTRAAADGTFRFERKASVGAATLVIEDQRHYFAATSRDLIGVQIEQRTTGVLELPIATGSCLTGVVVDRAKKPIPGALLYAETKLLFFPAELQPLAETDTEGRFSICGIAPAGQQLVVQKPGYGRCTVPASPMTGKKRALEPIVLEPSGTIKGHVRRAGRPSQPAHGALVSIELDGMTTVTGADGGFVLRDVPPGTHELFVRYSTLSKVRFKESVEVAAGAVVSGIVIPIAGSRTVSGEIVDLNGRPVPDVVLGVNNEIGDPVYANPDGTFVDVELPEEDVSLSAMTLDFEWFGFVEVEARQEWVRLQIPLPSKTSLSARVFGLPERKACSVGVLRIDPVEGSGLPGIGNLAQLLGPTIRPRVVTMQGGVLKIERIPVGAWQLVLHCQGYAPYETKIVAKAQEPIDLGTILLEPGSKVRGVVVDSGGQPVAGARVLLGEESDLMFRRIGGVGVATDSQGRFELSGVTQRSNRLIVAAEGLARRRVDLSLPRDLLRKDPLLVELGRGSTIKVRVVDPAGRPVDRGRVFLLRDELPVQNQLLGEDGTATFSHRGLGSYKVTFFAKNVPPKTIDVVEEDKTYEVSLVWPGRR